MNSAKLKRSSTRGSKSGCPFTPGSPQEQALKINGLRAVFGEKYPPMVRVVSVGAPSRTAQRSANEKWRQYSIEFCGARTSPTPPKLAASSSLLRNPSARHPSHVGLTGDAAKQSQALASQLHGAVDQARSSPESEIPGAIFTIQKHLAAPACLFAKTKSPTVVTNSSK